MILIVVAAFPEIVTIITPRTVQDIACTVFDGMMNLESISNFHINIFRFFILALSLYTIQGAMLNYELLSDKIYNVTFTVTDGIDFAKTSIDIFIQDTNDPPSFLTTTYYIWTNESQV